MVSRVRTVAFQGIEAVPVDVQVMVAPGKVNMHIVGLPDKAVAESRERVQAALHASGLSMPSKKVTVNLAPADLPKEGSHYDLPIALGLMAALGAIPGDALADYVVLGELSLDGTITAVSGALPAAIGADADGKGLICPAASVKSFGRRQAYESPRGRNPRATGDGYGDFGFRLMSSMARPSSGSAAMDSDRPLLWASARCCRPGAGPGARLSASAITMDTRGPIAEGRAPAAEGWTMSCRVMGRSPGSPRPCPAVRAAASTVRTLR